MTANERVRERLVRTLAESEGPEPLREQVETERVQPFDPQGRAVLDWRTRLIGYASAALGGLVQLNGSAPPGYGAPPAEVAEAAWKYAEAMLHSEPPYIRDPFAKYQPSQEVAAMLEGQADERPS